MKCWNAVFLLFLLVVMPGAALACSCLRPLTVQGNFDLSTRVFVGRAIAIEPGHDVRESVPYNLIRFSVSETFKGSPTRTLEVISNTEAPACGYHFEVGKEYVVYAFGPEEQPETGLCSLTGPSESPGSGRKALREIIGKSP